MELVLFETSESDSQVLQLPPDLLNSIPDPQGPADAASEFLQLPRQEQNPAYASGRTRHTQNPQERNSHFRA